MENFNRLPFDITLDIITRLPTESVLDCKLVSKTWRHLIQHPSFGQMHLNRLNRFADPCKLSFLALALNADRNFYYFEYIENHKTPIQIRRMKLTSPSQLQNPIEIVGSFNGLICLRDMVVENRFCICNPLTKECVILPIPNSGHYSYWSSGFGYLPSTDGYKVVALYKYRFCLEAMVYTLGSGNGWRNVAKFDSKFIYCRDYRTYSGPGGFLNGSLYWWQDGGMLVVLDLVGGNFGEQLQNHAASLGNKRNPVEIRVLGGYLFCIERHESYGDQETTYSVWIYKNKNNGNETKANEEPYPSSGWTYEFGHSKRQPFALTKSGKFLCYSPCFLKIYDSKQFTSRTLAYVMQGFRNLLREHLAFFGTIRREKYQNNGAR